MLLHSSSSALFVSFFLVQIKKRLHFPSFFSETGNIFSETIAPASILFLHHLTPPTTIKEKFLDTFSNSSNHCAIHRVRRRGVFYDTEVHSECLCFSRYLLYFPRSAHFFQKMNSRGNGADNKSIETMLFTKAFYK